MHAVEERSVSLPQSLAEKLETPSAEKIETPSAKAKKIADLFIATLSKEKSLHAVPVQEFLTTDEQRALTTLCTPEIIQRLAKGEKGSTDFLKLNCGNHTTVWIHPQHPKVVFKIMKQSQASKQQEISRLAYAVTQQIEGCWVKIPRSTQIDLDQISVYVEERLPLELNSDQHNELWAHVLSHYKSAQATVTFKSNLKSLINHILILIERVGFWDVGNHNLPEVSIDGSGVCATDFENVTLGLSNKHQGLERLAKLFPEPTLSEELLSTLDREFPKIAEDQIRQHQALYARLPARLAPPLPSEEGLRSDFHRSFEEAKDLLVTRATALKEYASRGYFSGDEPISDPDTTLMAPEEKTLAEELVAQIKKRQNEMLGLPYTLCHKRMLTFQPGVVTPLACKEIYTHERFTAALSKLQQQGIILSWSSNYAHARAYDRLSSVSYEIAY